MKQLKSMRFWDILYPVFLYYAATILVLYAVNALLPPTVGTALLRQFITSLVILPFLYRFYRQEALPQSGGAGRKLLPAAVLVGGCFAVAWNNLLGMVHIADYSTSYGQVEQTFYTGRLALELAALCVVIPLVEELLYRGIVFGRARAWLGGTAAAVLSAVIFGAVHMNLVQFVYAAVFGLLLAYLAERGGVGCAAAAHMTANLTSVLRAETGALAFLEQGTAVQAFITALLFGAAAGGVYWIERQNFIYKIPKTH